MNYPSTQDQKRSSFLKNRFSLALIGLGALLLALSGGYYFNQSSQEAKSVAQLSLDGEVLFQKNCISCHGIDGIGENPKRSMGGPKASGGYLAPALNGTGHTWHHSDSDIFRTIKKGSMAEDSTMKGFAESLNDQQIEAVIQHFQSMWPMRIRLARLERAQR